ncbi:flagellar export chaperone FlgN [Gracilibacillus dipsosauri]|uniref:flagellar export chaperone FlgN n=1 Tax=Gracilibacillus dipsosauri TaxID=178340 RepID=UPI0006D0BDA7
MSVRKITQQLEKMIQLHESLLHVSKQKTEVLKEGNIEGLQRLLNQEQKHVQAINQMEQKRNEMVEIWANSNQLDQNTSVSTIIEQYAEGEERTALEAVTLRLAELLLDLRRQEDLNKQLTEQSLQFVRLSLDMVQPSLKNLNYGNGKTSQDSLSKRSVFDSKA